MIGQHVKVDERLLEHYCSRLLAGVGYDLVTLAGAVAFADRTVGRRQAKDSWTRSIRVTVPVFERDRWEQDGVTEALIETLGFVSGDNWAIEFVGRPGPVPKRQHPLRFDDRDVVALPFSNGLDSFSQWQLLKDREPGVTVMCVTTWTGALWGSGREWVEKAGREGREPRLAVPFRLSVRNAEPSYRTRSFAHFLFAALAAYQAGSKRVLIPEAGQASLGPSIVPFGKESPHRGSHPGYTARLARFLGLMLGTKINFEHPALWQTKGQVLADLKASGRHFGWNETRSCSRDFRTGIGRCQCGICGGCLLRRLSLHAARLSTSAEAYHWADLNAGSTETAGLCKRSDLNIAVCSVRSCEHLARAGEDVKLDGSRIGLAVDELRGGGLSFSGTGEELRYLLAAHRAEWRGFLAGLKPRSWLRAFAMAA